MNTEKLASAIKEEFPQIKLLYFFGSKAKGTDTPLSDYDFGVYFDKDSGNFTELQIDLINFLSKELKTDNIDLVVINTTEQPELKFHIIKEGILIINDDVARITIEPMILNEYFDFKLTLQKAGLTKAV